MTYRTLPNLPYNNSEHVHRWAWKLQPRLSLTQVCFAFLGFPVSPRLAHRLPGITYDAIEAAFVGYVYGASTCGQAALYQLGLTGIPITNVNNNCATGSTALFHATTLVRAGAARCPVGPLMAAAARASPGADRGPPMPRVFGAAAAEYFGLYGGGVEHLAKIGELFFSFLRRVCV